MSWRNPVLEIGNLISSADYSDGSAQNRFCTHSTVADATVTRSGAGAAIFGVMTNKPNVGEAAAVTLVGIEKIKSGAAFTRGNRLMSDASGKAILATIGNPSGAIALESATAADQLIPCLIFQAPDTP